MKYRVIGFLLIGIMLFMAINSLLQPIWTDWNNYYTTHDFYEQPKNTIETVFLGPSVVVASIYPPQLYKDYGLCSYNLGSAAQPLLASYYWLKEVYRLHAGSLKTIVLDVSYLRKEMTAEDCHKSLDNMHMSDVKMEAMRACTEKFGNSMSITCPVFTYHDRWDELDRQDYKAFLGLLHNNGKRGCYTESYIFDYSAQTDSNTLDTYYYPKLILDRNDEITVLNEDEVYYFFQMEQFCRNNGLQLIVIKTPTNNWSSSDHIAAEKLMNQTNIPFLDFNFTPYLESLNIYMATDSFDNWHLNYYGGTKITNWIGRYLTEQCRATDVRGDAKYSFMEEDVVKYNNTVELRMALLTENDPVEYLIRAKESSGTSTFVIVNDEAVGALTENQRQAFKALGLSKLSELEYGNAYLAMIQDGSIVFEKTIDDAQIVENQPVFPISEYGKLPNYHDYIIYSEGYKQGSIMSSCLIDGVEQGVNTRGLNMVVYNYQTDTVVDSCAFDTCTSSTRNADYFLRAQKLLEYDTVELDALDEDTKRVYQYCQRCRDKERMQLLRVDLTDADLCKFLDCYREVPRYTVYIAAMDDAATALTDDIRNYLGQMGLSTLSTLEYRDSYIGIIDGGQVVYEQKDHGELPISTSFFECQYIVSGGMESGNIASVRIDKSEYCPGNRGLNIVVYDRMTEQVIDSVCFDTGVIEQITSAEEVMP